MKCGLVIKLVGLRLSDGCESKKYTLNYVPSDYYDPCIFCDLNHDGHQGKSKLPGPTELSKTGKKKIIKPKATNNNESDCQSMDRNTPRQSISDPDETASVVLTTDEDSFSYPSTIPESPELSISHKIIEHDIEKEIPALVVTSIPGPMPGLIDLKLLQSSETPIILAKEEEPALLNHNDAYDIPVSEYEYLDSSPLPDLLPVKHFRQPTPTIAGIVRSPITQTISTTAPPPAISYPVSLKPVEKYVVERVPSVINKTLDLAALDDLDSIDMNESALETKKMSALDDTILKSYLMSLNPREDCRPYKKMKT